MEILSKDTIKTDILPNLSIGKRGLPVSEETRVAIVECILHKLKTGCQWAFVPVQQFVKEKDMTWQNIYYHFLKWSKEHLFFMLWISILKKYKKHLDLSCIQLDGSQTPCKKGGLAVGYQGRKHCKTTNMLFLADNQVQMLACSPPQEGQHNDLYDIQKLFESMCQMLEQAGLDTRFLFLNADAGFDSKEFRQICKTKQIHANIASNPRNSKQETDEIEYQYFDEKLYKRRTVIEHANAWMDSLRTVLIRFETLTVTWVSFIFLSFSVLFLRKLSRKKKFQTKKC